MPNAQEDYICLQLPIFIFSFFLAFQPCCSKMDTVQTDSSGLPSTDPSPSPQLPQMLDRNPTLTTNDRDIETIPRSCGDASGLAEGNVTVDSTASEDDEVQFVFSVPRRRRKKRKRYGHVPHLHAMLSESIDLAPLASLRV